MVDSRERFDVATEGERVALAVSSQEHQLQTGSELETEGGHGGGGGGGERGGSIGGSAGDLKVGVLPANFYFLLTCALSSDLEGIHMRMEVVR